MDKKKQLDLFTKEPIKEDWEKEWQDMPEFIQEKKGPEKQIIISFKNLEDMKEFGKLINQKLTYKTKSIWFPQVDIETAMNQRYTTKNES